MKLAVLYAGQGAQHPGMGKEFYEASPAFRAAFDSAALDFDLHRVCFEDPDGVLNQTEYTQPCMVAFACGVTAVLGLDREKLSACCEQAAEAGCVQICNYNCPGQLVIGGEKAAVEQAAALAKWREARKACEDAKQAVPAPAAACEQISMF